MSNGKPVEAVEEIFGMLFSRTLIVAGTLFGILFAWIGNIILTFSVPPTSSDLAGIKIALFLNALGFAAIGLFLIGGGISNQTIDKIIRTVMIIGGVIILVMTLSVSMSTLMSMASSYSGYGL